MSTDTTYRRADSPTRGRHLVAVQPLTAGQLIFAERPLLALPSLENRYRYNPRVCHACHAFVGGPVEHLRERYRRRRRPGIETPKQQQQQPSDHKQVNDDEEKDTAYCEEESNRTPDAAAAAFHSRSFDSDTDDDSGAWTMVPCRQRDCGHVYCSDECEQDAWTTHHYALCTARILPNTHPDDPPHPLVQFLQYAVETNEILLLVAEWWVAEHTTTTSSTIVGAVTTPTTPNQSFSSSRDDDDDQQNPYTDFVMKPWWDVVVLTASEEDEEKETKEDWLSQPGAFANPPPLPQQQQQQQECLHQICTEAAELLSRALTSMSSSSLRVPPLTAYDVAIRIGACEQNCLGIRQRSPLCRGDVLLGNRHLREQCHKEIVECLIEAGLIGNDDDDDATDDNENDGEELEEKNEEAEGNNIVSEWNHAAEKPANDKDNPEQIDDDSSGNNTEHKCEYTVDEIAMCLSKLFMDEDRSVLDKNHPMKTTESQDDDKDETQEFDDLDLLFPPLDGTAMYSITCKMNHSCDPNVIAVYKRRTGWGSQHPLTVFVVALRDIHEGEELTISYIDAQQPVEERQAALQNYGFICQCSRCQAERRCESNSKQVPDNNSSPVVSNDLFESDSDEGEGGVLDVEDGKSVDAEDGEAALQRRLSRLDTVANHSKFGAIPVKCIGPLLAFLHQTVAEITASKDLDANSDVLTLLNQCAGAVLNKDYCMCDIVGHDLEAMLFSILKRDGQWSSVAYRKAYWCGCLTAALALSHEYSFVQAQNMIDKALMLGLSRNDNLVASFVDYVENHATEVCSSPLLFGFSCVVSDYADEKLVRLLHKEGLSRPIQSPVEEAADGMSLEDFHSNVASNSQSIVVRGFGRRWPAVTKWRDLHYFSRHHGHRLVPIECGSMLDAKLKEKIMTLRSFTQSFLITSTSKLCWSLFDCCEKTDEIAYLAQHPLLEQIPLLQHDVDMSPHLCGPGGPSNVYVWIGTGGTRTPLHYDSYDNLFVQLVGAKYVRLYSEKETQNLYVGSKSSFGLQGNMSDLDCEQEDWQKYPKSKSAHFAEVMLLPGDLLYIPARTWHYVRSLSTSISVNYWY